MFYVPARRKACHLITMSTKRQIKIPNRAHAHNTIPSPRKIDTCIKICIRIFRKLLKPIMLYIFINIHPLFQTIILFKIYTF